jgi:hypothetical protein
MLAKRKLTVATTISCKKIVYTVGCFTATHSVNAQGSIGETLTIRDV